MVLIDRHPDNLSVKTTVLAESGRTGILLLAVFFLALSASCNRVKEEFYPNGNKKSSLHYQGRQLHGLAVYYHENGNKSMEFQYRHGLLEGPSRRWDYNGNLLSTEQYQQNMKEGLSVFYNEHGRKIREETYRRDTLHGPFAEYYVTGWPSVQGHYQKGQFDGTWKYFDSNGKEIGTGVFTHGNGVLKGWYPDGKIMREVHYQNSLKEGREILYRPDGSVEQVRCFHQGALLTGDHPC